MSALLIPIALDVLLARDGNGAYAPTKMETPVPSAVNARRQRLLPPPFGQDVSRNAGAYLHWALPDGLTRARPSADGQAPIYPAIPERWLVFRLTGDAAGPVPRTVTAWLLPDVNDPSGPTVSPDVLVAGAPAVGPRPDKPLTVLGTGDLSWSAYYDNVEHRLSLYDDLAGVAGAISYAVCGWYSHIGLDPLNGLGPADLATFLAEKGWALPAGENASGPRHPTSSIFHGAVTGLGWPTAGWPGDGGVLGIEVGGPPDPGSIDVVVADTLTEASAALALTPDGVPADPHTQRLMQATLEGMLAHLSQPNGPAALDTSLHMSRFASLASDTNTETIWQPSDVAPASRTPRAAGAGTPGASPQRANQDTPTENGLVVGATTLAGAVAASRRRAGDEAQRDPTGPDLGGSLVGAERTTPRIFAPLDPVIVLRGASRSFKHGGDSRLREDQTLLVRLSGDTVTSFRAAGAAPLDAATMLPPDFGARLAALAPPSEVLDLIHEVVSLDPSSATDLTLATTTAGSPDATARAAWLNDPTVVTDAVQGVLPSPIGVLSAVRPWTPLHVEWRLDWLAATNGAHDFTLGDVDFAVPDAGSLPVTATARPLAGRSLLSGSPARIAAGGVDAALHQLRTAGVLEDHPTAQHFAGVAEAVIAQDQKAGVVGRAAMTGLNGAAADQDLLGGTLEDFLAQLRGEDTSPVVRPVASTSSHPSQPTNPEVVRAGFARIKRVRVIDGFGQYVDLLGSSATQEADETKLVVGAGEVVDGEPGLVGLVPRFNARARVLLRYGAADGTAREADTATSPLCGFVLPSAIDGSLEFFDANGLALGRIRKDIHLGAAWEEDPGQPSSFGRKPSAAITVNAILGRLADGLLASDIALALRGRGVGEQSALEALSQLIDITRWTVDTSATVGDEHAALLLGHPIAVMRAAIKVDVQGTAPHSDAVTTAIPAKLGTLAHTQDGLLAYYIDNDYTQVRAVDPAVGAVAPPGGQPLNSTYVDLSASFDVQPEQTVDLTLLMVPGADVHVTLGLLPQKKVGMRREWVSDALATLTPNWRFGPVLLDPEVVRVPVAGDVRGIWTWYHRPTPTSWASESIVNANATAVIPEAPSVAEHGWIRLHLTPDPDFDGIPVEVMCITKPIRDEHHRIKGIGGLNGDGSRWWMTQEEAIQMVETGRFFFHVRDGDTRIKIETDVTDRGTKFIRTMPDGIPTNDLDALPECPPP